MIFFHPIQELASSIKSLVMKKFERKAKVVHFPDIFWFIYSHQFLDLSDLCLDDDNRYITSFSC